MSAKIKSLLESALFSLTYAQNCKGEEAEMFAELAAMSDAEIENIVSALLASN